MAERFIAKEALVELGTQIFITAGVSKEESRRVSENLVEANLYGHDSHGIGLVTKRASLPRQGATLGGATTFTK